MIPELAKRLLAAKHKLEHAKAMVDLHTKVAAAASDELLTILSDPAMEQTLRDASYVQPDPISASDPDPVIKPGIRRVEVVGPMTVKAVEK